ncbi:spherulation-specific family 4 protein [Embleya sp. AB8]|uniref:spherulation-specific family 4 protein n=1 Tax=Embleya sp. AB8 TaxID=3156304 RepID=UPI003C73E9E3
MRKRLHHRSRLGSAAVGLAAAGALIGASLTVGASSATAVPGPGIGQKIAVPAYIHPGVHPEDWTTLGNAATKADVVIANVYNGPTEDRVDTFAARFAAAHAAGSKVIGYVDTGYLGTSSEHLAARTGDSGIAAWRAQIERDIDTWYRLYGSDIGGIFFDQVQNVCGTAGDPEAYVSVYRELNEYAKKYHPGAYTIDNPGAPTDQCYVTAADTLATFEGTRNTYLGLDTTDEAKKYHPAPWEATVDPEKIYHLVYATAENQVPEVLAKSKERNAGYVYVTDDVMPNPWDTLPHGTYWTTELAGAKVTPTTAPAVPALPTATAVSATSVTLSWPAAGGTTVAGYDVYSGSDYLGSVAPQASGNPQFTAKGLTAGTAYSFTVKARNDARVVSAASPALVVTTSPPSTADPGVPGSFTGTTPGPTSVSLSWTAAAQTAAPIVGYDVYQNGVRNLSLPANQLSALVGDLEPGRAYTYSVQARDITGRTSAATANVVLTPPAPPNGPIYPASASYNSTLATYNAQYNLPYSSHHVFIDTDNSWNSGYQIWVNGKALGADIMIENGAALRWVRDPVKYPETSDPATNKRNAWEQWQPIPNFTPVIQSTNGNYIWRIPTSYFAPGWTTTQQVAFHGVGGSKEFWLTPFAVNQSAG